MVISIDGVVVLYVAFTTGTLLSALLIAFLTSPRFRRDLSRASNQGIKGEYDPIWGVSFRIKGLLISLVFAFLASWIALIYFSRTDVVTPTEKAEVRKEEVQAQNEIAAAYKPTQVTAIKLRAFYTGQYGRSPFGQHFDCGTDPAEAARKVCGSDEPVAIQAVAAHGGNRCGYTYYAVACVPK
jgi:hypothetical protein